MSNSLDVKVVSVDFGAYAGANHRPLVYIPSNGGGITLLSAKVIGSGAGTAVGLILTSQTDAGTPALAGTHGTWAGTIVYAEGVPFSATLSTTYVAGGQWIGLDQTSGTAPANAVLSLAYVIGK
jgi:hypothetical protein